MERSPLEIGNLMTHDSTGTRIADADARQVERIANSLNLSPEALEQLQSLREQVTLTLSHEFGVVAGDLNQLRGILSDAAQKLSGTFRVVSATSDELRRTLGQANASDLPVLQRLNEIANEMTSTSGQTAQSLQFEDMATQLLAHVDRKLGVLAKLAQEMAVINPSAATTAPALPADQLNGLFARLEEYRRELANATRKVVQQQSLESGDIELF
jgi:hypothetical protein